MSDLQPAQPVRTPAAAPLLNFGLPHRSDSIKALANSLAHARKDFKVAAEDSVNPQFKNKYADVAAVIEACVPALSAHGIAITAAMHYMPGDNGARGVSVMEMRLMHGASGEFISSFFPLMPLDNKPQSMGSAMTYARRYCLTALVLVVTGQDVDDDANKASNPDKSDTTNKPRHLNPASGNALLCEKLASAPNLQMLKSIMSGATQSGAAEDNAVQMAFAKRHKQLLSNGTSTPQDDPRRGRAAIARMLDQ